MSRLNDKETFDYRIDNNEKSKKKDALKQNKIFDKIFKKKDKK